MFKRLRKTVVLVAFAAVLAVSALGATTVTQAITGHTPTAHADGLGGSYLEAICVADSGLGMDNNDASYIDIQGDNQYGNWVEYDSPMSYDNGGTTFPNPATGSPASTYVITFGWWWVGQVQMTFWDGWGDTWVEYATIDPGTYGGRFVWVC